MLSQIYPGETLKSILIPQGEWHPYPTAEEREPWESLTESLQKVHISRGEKALNYEWPTILAVRFLDFVRTGDRERYQQIS